MSLTTSKHKRQEDLKSATVSRSETEAADPDSEYLSAHEAAQALGVSVQTLYVYVGRKGIRSQPVPGSRQRRYWKPDIKRVLNREQAPQQTAGQLARETRS